MESELINKIANSPLITLDMEQYAPVMNFAAFDLKDYLFHGLILKEKDFREALKAFDWSQFEGRDLIVYCSTDAIIPMWAYMLVATYATPIALNVLNMDEQEYIRYKWSEAINNLDISSYKDKRMIIKGCSDHPIPPAAYSLITSRLVNFANSIMFGEPCSTVPVYKQKAIKA